MLELKFTGLSSFGADTFWSKENFLIYQFYISKLCHNKFHYLSFRKYTYLTHENMYLS